MNPPDWPFARFLVQQYFPFPVGQLTAAEFLSAYWHHVMQFRLLQAGKFNGDALEIAKQKLHDTLYMRELKS